MCSARDADSSGETRPEETPTPHRRPDGRTIISRILDYLPFAGHVSGGTGPTSNYPTETPLDRAKGVADPRAADAVRRRRGR
jgi:hypothetical protein